MPIRTRSVGEFQYRALEESKSAHDRLWLAMALGPVLIETARGVRKRAVSYRGFLVGAVAVADYPEETILRCYAGVNHTPTKGAPKFCAEKEAIGKARAKGPIELPMLFVAGSSNVEEIKGVNSVPASTLFPCRDACMPLIQDSTVVVSVGAEEDVYQVHTARQLRQGVYRRPNSYVPNEKRRPPIQNPAIYDPGFSLFALTQALYLESVNRPGFAPYEDSRQARADALVSAFYNAQTVG
jgi:cytidine deaminase